MTQSEVDTAHANKSYLSAPTFIRQQPDRDLRLHGSRGPGIVHKKQLSSLKGLCLITLQHFRTPCLASFFIPPLELLGSENVRNYYFVLHDGVCLWQCGTPELRTKFIFTCFLQWFSLSLPDLWAPGVCICLWIVTISENTSWKSLYGC